MSPACSQWHVGDYGSVGGCALGELAPLESQVRTYLGL